MPKNKGKTVGKSLLAKMFAKESMTYQTAKQLATQIY